MTTGGRRADPALGGLDEQVARAWAWVCDPGLSEGARREAAGYARGLAQALYVLAGWPCPPWRGGRRACLAVSRRGRRGGCRR